MINSTYDVLWIIGESVNIDDRKVFTTKRKTCSNEETSGDETEDDPDLPRLLLSISKEQTYLQINLYTMITELKMCLDTGKLKKSKNQLYSDSTVRGYILTLRSVLPKYGNCIGNWIEKKGELMNHAKNLPQNNSGQSTDHGKTAAALNLFWKFLHVIYNVHF